LLLLEREILRFEDEALFELEELDLDGNVVVELGVGRMLVASGAREGAGY